MREIEWETSKKDSLSALEQQIEILKEQLQKADRQHKDKVILCYFEFSRIYRNIMVI
jgi:hypothetical protein